MFDFGKEIAKAPTHALVDHEWSRGAAGDAYRPGIHPVLDNGAKVRVGADGLPRIVVTDGLIQELGALGKDLKAGDEIVVAPTP